MSEKFSKWMIWSGLILIAICAAIFSVGLLLDSTGSLDHMKAETRSLKLSILGDNEVWSCYNSYRAACGLMLEDCTTTLGSYVPIGDGLDIACARAVVIYRNETGVGE